MQCNCPTVINTSPCTLTSFPYLPDECTLDLDALSHSLQISQPQGLLAQYLESILLYKTSQKGRKLIRVMAFISQQCQPGFRGCIHVQLQRCVCFLRAGVFDGEPKADNPLYQQQATKIVQSPTEKLVSLQFATL